MKRVVVKIGSSSLTDEAGRIDPPRLWALARAVQLLPAQVAVVSSGAVAAGCGLLRRERPRTLPEKQALAAIGQAALMMDWARAFAPRSVAQFLLSADDIGERKRFVQAKHALEAAFRLGVTPIVNENDTVATEELRVGDNDALSAWVAYLVEAEQLILLTDVDALYTANPRVDPTAQRIAQVTDIAQVQGLAGDAGSSRGTGGMRTKLKAAQIATSAGIETIILGGGGLGLEAWLHGADVGTRFLARAGSSRRGWLAYQKPQGRVVVDAGAVRALRQGRSLLPSGVTDVQGSFAFGDVVQVIGPDGVAAQGLTNYGSGDLQRIKGAKTADIEHILGHKDFDEVVHRSHMVLTTGTEPMVP